MNVRIKFFGMLAEVTGKAEMDFDHVNDVDSLHKKVIADFPKLGNHQFVIAVNKKIVDRNATLYAGDVVAFLPPFAGG